MVHWIPSRLRSALFYALLASVHLFHCLIPFGAALHQDQGPAHPVAPSSIGGAWHAEHGSYYPHYNGGYYSPHDGSLVYPLPHLRAGPYIIDFPEHSAAAGAIPPPPRFIPVTTPSSATMSYQNRPVYVLLQPLSAGYYKIEHAPHASNHVSTEAIPPPPVLTPMGVLIPADVPHEIAGHGGEVPLHQPPGHLNTLRASSVAAESQSHSGIRSPPSPFSTEIKQKMLSSHPFIPANRVEKNHQSHTSSVNKDENGKQGAESQAPPKDPETDIQESENELAEGGAELNALKFPHEAKVSSEIAKSDGTHDADNPSYLALVRNDILRKLDINPTTLVVNDEVLESRESHGSNEAPPESLPGAVMPRPERDEPPSSSDPESPSSSESNASSQKSPRGPIESSTREEPTVKEEQPPTKKQQQKSETVSSKIGQALEKNEESSPRVDEQEYPSLAYSTARRRTSQQEGQKTGVPQESDRSPATARLRSSSQESDSPRNPKATAISNSKRRVTRVRESTSENPLDISGESNRARLQVPNPLAILDDKDYTAIEKTRILLGIQKPAGRKPAPEPMPNTVTLPQNNKQLKKEAPTKAKDQNLNTNTKLGAKKPSNPQTASLQTTAMPVVQMSSKNLEIQAGAATSKLGETHTTETLTTASKTSLVPAGSPRDIGRTTKFPGAPDGSLASNNEGKLPETQASKNRRLATEESQTGSLSPKAIQVSKTDPLVPSGAQSRSRDGKSSPLKGGSLNGIKDDKARKATSAKEEVKTSPPLYESPKSSPSVLEISRTPDKLGSSSVSGMEKKPTHYATLNTPDIKNPSLPTNKPSSAPVSTQATTQDIARDSSDENLSGNIGQGHNHLMQDMKRPKKKTRQAERRQDSKLGPSRLSSSSQNHKSSSSNSFHNNVWETINEKGIISLTSAFRKETWGEDRKTIEAIKHQIMLYPSTHDLNDKANMEAKKIFDKFLRVQTPDEHLHLDFLSKLDYDKLFSIWSDDPLGYEIAETLARVDIGIYEGTRRILILRRQILRHSNAKRWAVLREKWFFLPVDARIETVEARYGISSDPSKIRDIPESSLLPRYLRQEWEKNPAMETPWGKTEWQRQLKMREYLRERQNPYIWWKDVDLDDQSKSFGRDILIILKAGDSLQFGSNSFLRRGHGRITIDKAFAQLIEVMTDPDRPLPWIESSERAWLHSYDEGNYKQRLQELSRAISETGPVENPDSAAILIKKTNNQAFVRDNRTQMGKVLILLDQGHQLNELSKTIETTKVVLDRAFIAPSPGHLEFAEIRDLLTTSVYYFWNIFKESFLANSKTLTRLANLY